MNVITSVLNKLFDEDDIDHYVGDYHAIHPNSNNIQSPTPIEPNTANIIRNINKRTNFISRKNLRKQVVNNTNIHGCNKTKKK